MSLKILGVNAAYHESSASLLVDGQLIASIEEERMNRVKHAKPALIDNPDELPVDAIMECLRIAELSLSDVDIVAFSFDPKRRMALHANMTDPTTPGDWGTPAGEYLFCSQLLSVPEKFRRLGFKGQFHWVEHAKAHAASAFYPAPFEDAAILSIDGIGEIESVLLAHGKKDTITPLKQIVYPNSLGFLWEKMAKYLGHSEYDACKVMSLASFGNPAIYEDSFRSFIKISEDDFEIDPLVILFRIEDYAPLEKLFGLPRRKADEPLRQEHMDIAAALQQLTTTILLNLTRHLHALTGSSALCLAGGVALNCVANRVLFEEGPFEHIYIQPAANDAGTSLGAALFTHYNIYGGDNYQPFELKHTYLGPGYSDEEIGYTLKGLGVNFEYLDNIETTVAGLISEGKVVGWFQGNMEFGPRALGNRSLLADPRNPDMVKRMNRLVKHREDHRPFCPSVLEEDAANWFEIRKDALASRFMLMAYPVNPAKREQIPAVVHVDGTCRIQQVQATTNPKYHQLISEFKKITGVPVLLNTSFNDREPIVCTPDDAIRTFLKTKIDYLAIGNFLLKKENNLTGNREAAMAAYA
ncbi:carbamoyltransferase family protein [Chitinophaga nivalis]|uniref:Carbamoyltransferase n=1 Tax=Chitinophaga nivalis TaxID=2991709 RepID=A0ABT3IJ35_9BACT|nr:carbamoyltransferase C-terminal domain-containing protein [Chitinophaga nivalis]MCW3466352.1 carbamoyltransferase [Chitinophaga nivalis]MCW3483957.1 carbamoyltransferase [Chitinophaga nivalis]